MYSFANDMIPIGVERGRIDVHNGASDRSLPPAGQPFGFRPTNSKRKRPFPKTQEGREKFLNSFIFEHIEDRYNNIKLAHSATCQWLLTNEKYLSWKDKEQVSHHHGLLWLKGKPGAGKSTIIKFALTEAKRSRMEDIHTSFFFNARGSLLEKDIRGMYRSLLFQLLTKLPQAQEVFDEFDILELPQAPGYSWTIMQLKAVLNRAIQELGERSLWIYVDALDECDEDQIRDMVVFFDLLGQHTVTSDINMRVFFASRYYPRIITPKKVELRLEDEEEHSHDIERYIQGELRTGRDTQSTTIERVRGEVKRRASGVFIWVVLVVQILNKAYDHGRILGLEKRLQEIPDDLGQLFRGIITRDGQNMESMRLCIQWILFAKRPLTREELYFAIYSGTDPEEVGSWNSEGITTEVMDAFILSCSKGLAELTHSRKPTVQFIHETIRDFLLKENGMQYIQGTSTQSLVGSGHNSLKQCCINYVSSAQKFLSSSPPVNINSLGTVDSHGQMGPARPPFIGYALLHIFYHANAAQANGVSQVSFFKEFSVQHWIHLTKMFSEPGTMQVSKPRPGSVRRYSPDLSLLNILTQENLPSLIKMVLEIDPQADIDGSIHDSPLRTALEHRHYDALGALLTPPRAQNSVSHPASLLRPPDRSELDSLIGIYYFCSKQGISAESILYLYFQWGAKSDVAVLLRSGRFRSDANISAAMQCSPLSVAAERGYEDVVKSLLDQQDVDPNLQDYLGLTPLSRAIREGRLNVVSLLVQSTQIDINLQCSAGRSPLSYAAENGYEDIFKLVFCHPDVGVNLRDKKGRTPFFYAAMRGREGIIRLLINFTGVDVISRDSIGHTALSYAVMNGHEGVVRQLLDTSKVDVNSRDTIHGRTPLLFALEYGYKTIAKLLLDEPDIDVHLANNRGRTPLDYARDKGMYEAAALMERRS
jgi:ankyrin repeat protein